MFNFNLQNRAFEELNAEQFRMIYFLNNTLSMVNEKHNTPNNDKVEMFNGYMMDKLGLSERQVQRLIKSIENSGFISVERATRKKSPNIITINSDMNCDMNCDKNVTLNKKDIRNNKDNNIKLEYNNNKNKNNFSTSTSLDMDENEKIDTNWECNNSNTSCDDELLDLVFSSGSGTGSNDGQVINDLKVIKMEGNKLKKENEMSDNGAIGMNAKSEMKWNVKQGSNNVAECGKENEMTTPLATAFNDKQDIPSKENVNNNSKLQDNCSIFKEDCPKTSLTPQIALHPPLSPIKGTGATKIIPMGSYATQEDWTQPEAQECPQIEFNYREWCEVMNKLMEYTPKVDDMDEFKTLLKKIDGMMQDLKGKVSQRQYNYNCKNIAAWFNSNSFDQDFDKICLAGDLKRKYNYN